MKVGKTIIKPEIGHIVVFWREEEKGWKGHVGLFAGYTEDKTSIFVLGGNQNNMINIASYPVLAPNYGLLGFREIDLQ